MRNPATAYLQISFNSLNAKDESMIIHTFGIIILKQQLMTEITCTYNKSLESPLYLNLQQNIDKF